MSEISKEQIIYAAENRVQLAESMLSDDLEPLQERTWSIELALASNALLALREEPVAYRYRFRPTREAAGKWILVDTLEEANPLPKYEVQPLYTAPPEPVVPDVERMKEIYSLFCTPTTGSDNAMVAIHKACRAAMLATPSGKEG